MELSHLSPTGNVPMGRGRHVLMNAQRALQVEPMVGRVRTLSGVSDGSIGSGSGSSEVPVEDCDYCNRASQKIICRSCGYLFPGRVRGHCEHHPEVIYLMDFTMCPRETCRSFMIAEVDMAAKVASPTGPLHGPISPSWTPPRKSPVSPGSRGHLVSPGASPGLVLRKTGPVVWGRGAGEKMPLQATPPLPGRNPPSTSPWKQEAAGFTGRTRLF